MIAEQETEYQTEFAAAEEKKLWNTLRTRQTDKSIHKNYLIMYE